MPFTQFVLKFSVEMREWVKLLIPVILAIHLPQPTYMKKKPDDVTVK